MSWFKNVFGWIPRLLGWGRPKDIPIPSPLPGSERMRLEGDGSERANEAIAVLCGFIREPYQITDRELRIASVSWEEGREYFSLYGYKPENWRNTREGNFYAPKPGLLDAGLIHLVIKRLDQRNRVFLALHEYGHAVWHWLLTDQEWMGWQARGYSYEEFADDFARRMLGEKLSGDKARFFDALEARLREQGTKAQRL